MKVKKLINALSHGIEITERPFLKISEKVGMSEDETVETVKMLLLEKKIRRFAAIIRQGKVGYAANAMCAFNVSDDRIREAGTAAAALNEVSHCYERERAETWNYNLYAMVHAKDADGCRKIAKKIAAAAKTKDFKVIFSTKELKKQNAIYFNEINEIETAEQL